MSKWIRWKGLIAFAAVVAVIALIWILVVDTVVRRAIEIVGTHAVGAEVDLAKADLSLFPTGLELTGLAVTNPDSPMRNIVEIGKMKMDLDPAYLIKRKVIVNAMVMEGLRFDTPRKKSGALPQTTAKPGRENKAAVPGVSKTAAEKVCGSFTLPSLSRPDVKTILAKENLDSLKLAGNLDQTIKAERERWEKELQQLPDEKKLKAYRQRVEKLKHSGGSLGAILGAAGDVRQLQADIRKDLKRLQQARTEFSTDLKRDRQQLAAIPSASLKDVHRLADKYSLSTSGLANPSRLLFGQKLCGWMHTAATWYHKAAPYIHRLPKGPGEAPATQKPLRGKGENIRFAETPPMPDFLIRHLKVAAQLPVGGLTGKADDITPDQQLLGRPTTFAFSGKKMKRLDALQLTGIANHVNPQAPKNSARMTIDGLKLENLALVQETSFPLSLQKALGNLHLNLQTAGDHLNGTLKANFTDARFLPGAGGPQTALASAIAAAIDHIRRFSLAADISGTWEDYSLNITSDLDKTLKSAAGGLVRQESAKLQSALKAQIDAKLQAPLKKVQGNLQGMNGIEKELTQRLNLGNDLMKGLKLPF
jgi:uncharacterized protein (TIGR03545 family)